MFTEVPLTKRDYVKEGGIPWRKLFIKGCYLKLAGGSLLKKATHPAGAELDEHTG